MAQHEKALASQFFVNFLHKCNNAITIINKGKFGDELRIVLDESERQIDRMVYSSGLNNDTMELTDTYETNFTLINRGQNKNLDFLKVLISNLRVILSIIS